MVFNTNNTERMRITSAGLVGIGNNSPSGILDVSGSGSGSGTNWVFLRGGNTGGAAFPGIAAGIAIGNNFSNGSSETNLIWGQTIGSGQFFSISKWTGSAVTEQMRIDSSGNLLVGTTTANGRISSVSKSGFNPVSTAGTWSTDSAISVASSFGGGVSWIDGSGGYCAWVDDSGTDFNIAGGTTSSTVSNGVFLNGHAATSWSSRSDERLKDKIEPITDAINKVNSLRAVTGVYKNFPDNRQAFLFAQDVQAVLPEAVSIADKKSPEQYLGLAYTQVIPLLVAAIQEIKAELDSVKAELQTLKGK
jgi:hypothetical protein